MENNTKTRIRWDQATFVTFVSKLHNNKYDYSNTVYRTLHHSVRIICPIHGEFEQLANHHKKGHGCPKCSVDRISKTQADDTRTFIEKAKTVHGERYDYSKTVYGNNAHEKVVLICRVHGPFSISPNSHLSKACGCKKCGKTLARRKLIRQGNGSWSKSDWVALAKGRQAKLYVIECFNKEEKFIKIGITYKHLKRRFSKFPYKYNIVKIIGSYNAGYIYDLEKVLLRNTKQFRYCPKIAFNGYTECREIEAFKEFADCH